MTYPVKKVYITQKHGVNEEIYKRFGFLGHNGVDLRLHNGNGTPIYAPHSGVVKERRTDEDGYGRYLKIESEVEGSILGHLKDWNVNINKEVEEGDLIAWGDNTGWSTGPHLHWGYYRHPRDRQNGYGGTIDPTPFINQELEEDTMWENIKNFLSEKKVPVEQAESKIRAWWESDSKLLQRTIDYENTKTGLEEKIRKLEEVVTDDHDWADVADGLERRLKVLVFEMQEMGESVTKESEPGALVDAFKRLVEVKEIPVVPVEKKCLFDIIRAWLGIK